MVVALDMTTELLLVVVAALDMITGLLVVVEAAALDMNTESAAGWSQRGTNSTTTTWRLRRGRR